MPAHPTAPAQGCQRRRDRGKKERPDTNAGAFLFAIRLTVAEDYFFLVAVFFAADFVVFFETGFLGDAI
jgi:hypothetical protein